MKKNDIIKLLSTKKLSDNNRIYKSRNDLYQNFLGHDDINKNTSNLSKNNIK